jgi:amidophosphoribosyltransferase
MSGFFGEVSPNDCVDNVYYGTDYHSHLGTKRGGLAYYSKESGFQRAIHSLENSYFRTKFEDDIKNFSGNLGIGCISDTDSQPVMKFSKLGTFAIVTVAKINNLKEISEKLLNEGMSFSETTQGDIHPSEVVSMLICEKNNFVDGIINVFQTIKGSCSMLILQKDEIIAARDKFGRTPIVVGHRPEDNAYCVASESASFLNLGFKIYEYLGPGEIVSITTNGIKRLKAPEEKMQICSFLWVYYGYPPSFYENINVDKTRYACGQKLAESDGKMGVDFVAGIPDSGVGHALGYSNSMQVPYLRPYVKYTPTWPRSFMPQKQEQRELVAKMKLIPNSDIIKGMRGVFLDDSIVRGTQLRDNVKDLRDNGIKEIHMRIACPPLIYPCEFLNFSRSRSSMELATRKAVKKIVGGSLEGVDWKKYTDPDTPEYKAMVDEIRKELDLTSLKFQRLEDLVAAIGLPKCKLCTHCFDASSYGQ